MSVGCGQLSLGGGRLKNQAGNSAKLWVRARHDRGARGIGRSPVGAKIPRVRHPAGVLCERPRRGELHAPAVLHEEKRCRDSPRHECRDARMRASGAKKSRMKPPERRKDAAHYQSFRRAVERHAVERAGDPIGPDERRGGGQPPEPRCASAWQGRYRTIRRVDLKKAPGAVQSALSHRPRVHDYIQEAVAHGRSPATARSRGCRRGWRRPSAPARAADALVHRRRWRWRRCWSSSGRATR